MLQPAECLGLVLEAAEHLGIGISCPDDLERNRSPRTVLLRLVDGAHTALAQQAKNAVPADRGGQGLRILCRDRSAAGIPILRHGGGVVMVEHGSSFEGGNGARTGKRRHEDFRTGGQKKAFFRCKVSSFNRVNSFS
jgi:hypothetical protein